MNAYLGNTGKLLVKSLCTVGIDATVRSMTVNESLAG
jgi:hypothetical protein